MLMDEMTEVNYPYAVLVGLAGSGKKEIARKLAHPDFVSSNGDGSGTLSSDLFWTYDKSMVICDVPEDHPGSPIFKGNVPLALALTFEPVSLILITVKAEDDIHVVLANIKMYFDGLIGIYFNFDKIVGVMITGMDQILAWNRNEFKSLVEKEFSLRLIRCIIYIQRYHLCNGGSSLTQEIREMCGTKYDVSTSMIVLSDLININLTRMRKSTIWRLNRLVADYRNITKQFSLIWHDLEKKVTEKNVGVKKGDILFEFQAWMKDRIYIAYNKLADSANFAFEDCSAELEMLYLTSMGNQMKHILCGIKMKTKKYLVERDVDPRRCPYCNEIWTKDITMSCDGAATCGDPDKSFSLIGYYDKEFVQFGYYAFKFDADYGLRIRPCSKLTFHEYCDNRPIKIGCGRPINWEEMPQIYLPKELIGSIEATFKTSIEPETFANEVDLKPATHSEQVEQEPRNDAVFFEPCRIDNFTNDDAIRVKKILVEGVDTSKDANNFCQLPNSPPQNVESDLEDSGIKENYVVFIGDVGVGKSTVVEKLTGKKIYRGDSKLSVTRTSSAHWSYDGTVIVSDTPGSNSVQDQLQHNEEIAAAFNYRPISRVFVVVKADTRIANVMRVVEKYSERLLSLPDNNIGVLVTHMDTVSWDPRDLKKRLTDEYGIECVLFCGKETPKETLMDEIRGVCGSTISFRVDDGNFSDLFKINDKTVKILKDTSKVIDVFTKMREQFDKLAKEHNALSNLAFVRDFQSWLEIQITKAKERFIESNKFTFIGKDAAKEKGYIANLTNQIRVVFNNIAQLNEMNYQISNHDEDRTLYATYIFTWQHGEMNVIERMERKEIRANVPALPCEKTLESIKCTLPTKQCPLPPIPAYTNNDKQTEFLKASDHGSGVVASNVESNSNTLKSSLEIKRTGTHGAQKFSFSSKDEVSTVDDYLSRLSITGTENVTSEDNKNLCGTKGNARKQSQKIPPFSFKVNFDFSKFGQGIRSFTVQWQDDDLKIATLPDANNNVSVKGQVSEYALEQPEDVWGNTIVKIEPENQKKVNCKQEAEPTCVKERNPSKSSFGNDASYHEKPATRMKTTPSKNNMRQDIDSKTKSKLKRFFTQQKPKHPDEASAGGNKESKNVSSSTELIFHFEDDDFGTGLSQLSITLTPTPRGNEECLTKTLSSSAVSSDPRPSAISKTPSYLSQPPMSRTPLKRPVSSRNSLDRFNKTQKHTRL